ncbi:hypothetical protein [Endozoicomonas acroporae]|uniref:hypothetical protein n=1 Tax=Endozoicomonas acroporae TaxID=1701104 RepID=UPI0013D38C36|nr:hypothetical protein [Endozoicomonas acroporae]
MNISLIHKILFYILFLFLAGCVTGNMQKLPVDKIVLDWKDFYPINFKPNDNCNTFVGGKNNKEYMKQLCFSDIMHAVEDRFYVTVFVTKYDAYTKESKDLHKKFKQKEKSSAVLSELLFQNSKKFCQSNFKNITVNAIQCTPIENNDTDILLVVDYLFSQPEVGYGKILEGYVIKDIPKKTQINVNSSQYKTAVNILKSKDMEKLLH